MRRTLLEIIELTEFLFHIGGETVIVKNMSYEEMYKHTDHEISVEIYKNLEREKKLYTEVIITECKTCSQVLTIYKKVFRYVVKEEGKDGVKSTALTIR